MSLRGLGSLFTRRFFSPRAILHARAQAQTENLGLASHRRPPLSSLRTLMNLDIGDAARSIVGKISAVAIGVLLGILCSKKHDESFVDLIDKVTTTVVTGWKRRRPPVDDPDIRAKFRDEDGKVAWAEYLDYLDFLDLHPEVTDPKVHDEMTRRRYHKEEDVVKALEEECVCVDERAMKARFEKWMKEFERAYKDEEEKATRYEIFKMTAIRCDRHNYNAAATQKSCYAPNNLADYTKEEMYTPMSDSDWEDYFNNLSRMYAEGRVKGYPRTIETTLIKRWWSGMTGAGRLNKTRTQGRPQGRPKEEGLN